MEQDFQKKEDIPSLSKELGNDIKSQLDPLMQSPTRQGINLSQPIDSIPRPSKTISLKNKNPLTPSVGESITQRKTRPRLSLPLPVVPFLKISPVHQGWVESESNAD